jgi:hypothetical protein
MGFQSPVKALPPAWLDPFLIIVCQSSPESTCDLQAHYLCESIKNRWQVGKGAKAA